MKKYLLTLICTCFCFSVFSQSPNAVYSEPFDEPETNHTKVFQCSNGNTLVFDLGEKDGMHVTVYDKTHKASGKADFTSSMVDVQDLSLNDIDACYNIGGNVALFISQPKDKQPMLYRWLISPESGKLIREEKIGEVSKYERGAGYAMAFGGVGSKGFLVKKDPLSDAYAVAIIDPFAHETDKRVEVVHLDGIHKEISRSYLTGIGEKYKYTDLLAMVVRGTEDVICCTYAYNTKGSGGNASSLFLSTTKGNSFEHHEINLQRRINEPNVWLQLNPKSKMLEMLLTYQSGSKSAALSSTTNYYQALHAYINPTDYSV